MTKEEAITAVKLLFSDYEELEAENALLRKDKARLEWLWENAGITVYLGGSEIRHPGLNRKNSRAKIEQYIDTQLK